MSQRVIFDTSTLVSAALRIGSIPYQALLKGLATCDICASEETLAELERVLTFKKFDRFLDRTSRREFAAQIRRHAHFFVVKSEDLIAVHPGCRDLKDNQFLALALAAEAGILVSSDQDLLVLHPWRQVRILSPADFLAHVSLSREAVPPGNI